MAEVIFKSAKSNPIHLVSGFGVCWTELLQEFRPPLLATVLCLEDLENLKLYVVSELVEGNTVACHILKNGGYPAEPKLVCDEREFIWVTPYSVQLDVGR